MTGSATPVVQIARAVHAAGGRAYRVGGSVRDELLGLAPKDHDLEVYRLEPARLLALLETLGPVHDVGRSFGVLKVTLDGESIDVALPRRETKIARGHKGFAVATDPWLPEKDACARRDLTINAILLDPLSGEIVDPFGGRRDLERRLLRHVSAAFAEDPLRALRVVQFAARFEFAIDPGTAALCRSLDLTELPKERVFDEVAKWLLKPARPSFGLDALVETGALSLFPELAALRGVPQDAEWHPEGEVFRHTALSLDAAARLRERAKRPLAFMLGVLFHDLGKAVTTRFADGRLRAHAHDTGGADLARRAMERLTDETALIEEVARLVKAHLRPMQLERESSNVSDAAIRRLALEVDLEMLALVARADADGRVLPDAEVGDAAFLLARAAALDVKDKAPRPLLLGRHLLALGMAPGPAMGALLKEAFERQLDGRLATLGDAIAFAKERLAGAA